MLQTYLFFSFHLLNSSACSCICIWMIYYTSMYCYTKYWYIWYNCSSFTSLKYKNINLSAVRSRLWKYLFKEPHFWWVRMWFSLRHFPETFAYANLGTHWIWPRIITKHTQGSRYVRENTEKRVVHNSSSSALCLAVFPLGYRTLNDLLSTNMPATIHLESRIDVSWKERKCHTVPKYLLCVTYIEFKLYG